MEVSWVNNILFRIPASLRRMDMLGESLQEMKELYTFSIKRSVVDFALYGLQKVDVKVQKCRKRSELIKQNHCFPESSVTLKKRLFKVHPAIIRSKNIMYTPQFWEKQIIYYKKFCCETVCLDEFEEDVKKQINGYKALLAEGWLSSICNVVLKGVKKKVVPDLTERSGRRFLNTLRSLMTLQIEAVGLNAIEEYHQFLLRLQKMSIFRVSVLYEDGKIIFEPICERFTSVFLDIFDQIMSTINCIPSAETKMYMQDDSCAEFLKPIILEDTVRDCRNFGVNVVQDAWICVELKIQDFDEYMFLINGDVSEKISKFLSGDRTFDEYKAEVSYYHNLANHIQSSVPPVAHISMFEINRTNFINALQNKALEIRDMLLTEIGRKFRDMCCRLNKEFRVIYEAVLKPPIDTAELVKLKEYNLQLGTDVLFEMEHRIKDAMRCNLFLLDYVQSTRQQIKLDSVPFLWYRKIESILDKSRTIMLEKTLEFQNLLKERINQFTCDLTDWLKDVDEFRMYKESSELTTYLKKAQDLNEDLEIAGKTIKQFNEEEEAFGWPRSNYPLYEEIVAKLAPYKKLYENCVDYRNKYKLWTQARIGYYDPQIIENDVKKFYENVLESSKQFLQLREPLAISNDVKREIETFQAQIPLVKTLGNRDLKERHWEKVSEIVGFPLRADDNLILAKVLDYGLEEYVPKFQVISDSATKESQLEVELKLMMEEWNGLKFDIAPYRDSDTHILSSVEQIQTLLDDHSVKTQIMKASPYVKPFKNIIQCWGEKLVHIQLVIDTWLAVQRDWCTLEPIFGITDIHQLAEEASRFTAVTRIWKEIMKTIESNTEVLAVIEIEKLLERFSKCNTLLDMVQSNLIKYLDTKRLFFPRFFFISNEEVLKIISCGEDPRSVQPYLSKCFTGIRGLTFKSSDNICAIVSCCGEKLKLSVDVNTRHSRGHVEKWLTMLESSMRLTVRQGVLNAKEDLNAKCYSEWLKETPLQMTVVASYIIHTDEVVTALKKRTLSNLVNQYEQRIDQLVAMLRLNLTNQDRNKYSSLLTLNLYFTNTAKNFIEKCVTSLDDFEWMSKLQYYVEDEKVYSSILEMSSEYGYEYFGDDYFCSLLPDTDNYMRCVLSALTTRRGVHVRGCSASGKTEFVKFVARLLGKPCFLFNCSELMDLTFVQRIFKGLVTSGACICLDDFDRLNEITSLAVANNIIKLYQSQFELTAKVDIHGSEFKVEKNCLPFIITSKPKMRYKTDLPVTVKGFLCDIELNNTDLTSIAQTTLQCAGFSEAKPLAKKIVAILESFTDSDGLNVRSIRKIMEAIEMQKSRTSNMNEFEMVVKAIVDVYEPALSGSQLNLFKENFSNVFSECSATLPKGNDAAWNSIIEDICSELNLSCNDYISRKVKELYLLSNVRMGTILMGEAFAGKSTILRMCEEMYKKSKKKSDVTVTIINPKAMTLEQLYGYQDEKTYEWHDGVFTRCYRHAVESSTISRNIIVFDGSLDPQWAESLNSLLDDTRQFCLPSCENIEYSDKVTLIFETDNISHASPSTITRCNIVCVDSPVTTWKDMVSCWTRKLLPVISESNCSLLKMLILRFCTPLFYFLRQVSEKLIYPATECVLIQSLFNIYDCFTEDMKNDILENSLSEMDLRAQLEGVFFFSCIWSLGALLTDEDKLLFDTLFRALMAEKFPDEIRVKFNLPQEMCVSPTKPYIYPILDYGTVFDFRYIKEGKGRWKPWSELSASVTSIPRDVTFNQIIVPTKNSIRNSYLLSLMVQHQKPVLFVGGSAVGKTSTVKECLNGPLKDAGYKAVCFTLFAGSTGTSVQKILMETLERRKKGIYGPPLGVRYCLFFDDISSPLKDYCDSQSSLEFLRLMIERNKCYNSKDASPINLVDLHIVCCLTTNIVNAHPVSKRFTRHFNIIATDAYDDTTMRMIYSQIMLWHLDTRGFSKEFDPCINQIVNASIDLYKMCRMHFSRMSEQLHYAFSLTDISRTMQGVLFSVPEAIESLSAMKKLWIHEVVRTYQDRLIRNGDIYWFRDTLNDISSKHLDEDLSFMFRYLLQDGEFKVNSTVLRRLLFCDFMNPKADVRNYMEVLNVENLIPVVQSFLTEHNNISKKPMNLILCRYVIEHLSRICRILKQPGSHVLISGVRGAGRRSIARLAAHVCEYELFQIEATASYDTGAWRNDLKDLLFSVFTDQHAALLISDSELIEDGMLEDICQLIVCGQVNDLFTGDDKREIREKMEAIDSQRDKSLQTDGSPAALLGLFVERVRKQVHVMLVLDNVENSFQRYVKLFPTLTKQCSMDYFMPWPPDAFQEVATEILKNEEILVLYLGQLLVAAQYIHTSSSDSCKEMNVECKYHTCVTPNHYIQLLRFFKKFFSLKRQELLKRKEQYEIALRQLSQTESRKPVLNAEHENLLPMLQQKGLEIHQIEETVRSEKYAESQIEMKLKEAIEEYREAEKVSSVFRERYEKQLGEAQEHWDEVSEIVGSFSSGDANSLRSMKNPPKPLKLVVEAIALMKELKGEKILDSNGTGKIVEDHWRPTVRLLADQKFLESLIHIDKCNISARSIAILEEKFLNNDDFREDKINQCSPIALALYKWVMALYRYNKIVRIDSTLKLEVTNADQKVESAKLEIKRQEKEYADAQQKCKNSEDALNRKVNEFEQLKREEETYRKKKALAEKLTSLLSVNKDIWQLELRNVETELSTLIGDVFLLAGMITYLGPYELNSREYRLKLWHNKVVSLGIPVSETLPHCFNVFDTLQVKKHRLLMQQNIWFDDENINIIRATDKWPLMVDPEDIMNKWVKTVEGQSNLLVLKQSSDDLCQKLGEAVRCGQKVLIEDLTEYIDSSLYQLLGKVTFKTLTGVFIKIGDNTVEYNPDFRLYLTTGLKYPVFSPEIYSMVCVVNCSVTTENVQELLLGVIVEKFDQDLQSKKERTVTARLECEISKEESHQKILNIFNTQQDILELDNDVGIIVSCQSTLNSVCEQLLNIDDEEQLLDKKRSIYNETAKWFTAVYSITETLAKLHKFFGVPLDKFLTIANGTIDNVKTSGCFAHDLDCLKNSFVKTLFGAVSVFLPEKERLAFLGMLVLSFKLDLNVEESSKKWKFFLNYEPVEEILHSSPLSQLCDKSWNLIQHLETFSNFKGISKDIVYDSCAWDKMRNSEIKTPWDEIPQVWKEKLNSFDRVLLWKCIANKDKFAAATSFIKLAGEVMPDFFETDDLSFDEICRRTVPSMPILIMLFGEYAPLLDLINFLSNTSNSCNTYSLRSTNDYQAVITCLKKATKTGTHFVITDYPRNTSVVIWKKISEILSSDYIHHDFRLWMIVQQQCDIAEKILKCGFKIVCEKSFLQHH